jgi:hypothetical protein
MCITDHVVAGHPADQVFQILNETLMWVSRLFDTLGRRWRIERQIYSTGLDLASWWEPESPTETFRTQWGARRRQRALRRQGCFPTRIVSLSPGSSR